MSASPHRLILLLMEGTLAAVQIARQKILEKDIPAKGAAISKAISLIEEGLRLSLNTIEGGEIAQNLDSLYEYMCNRLLLANLNNDPAILDEVERLMGEIKSAWEGIAPEIGQAP